MPFTVNDARDLVRILELHPEWRAEVRRLVLPEELLTLPDLVRELAEMNRQALERLAGVEERLARAEERLAGVEERLARAEERLAGVEERLARAEERLAGVEERLAGVEERLAGVEERVARLEEAVLALVESQRRYDERLAAIEAEQQQTNVRLTSLEEGQQRLEHRFDGLEREVRSLQHVVGATAEESAEGMLYFILPNKGYELVGDPFSLRWNGEIDVVAEARDPEGRTVWVIVEAKVRLGRNAVITWSQRARSEGYRKHLKEAGVPGPYLPYVYGMRVDPAAVQAAEKFGIGLITSQDERLAPKELIEGL
ncbi:MAG: hypothetical protein KIT45_07665 [Fimbriimonadia bacterium]|nr:hypothetical protein [Fimbriimonadia bacterium]